MSQICRSFFSKWNTFDCIVIHHGLWPYMCSHIITILIIQDWCVCDHLWRNTWTEDGDNRLNVVQFYIWSTSNTTSKQFNINWQWQSIMWHTYTSHENLWHALLCIMINWVSVVFLVQRGHHIIYWWCAVSCFCTSIIKVDGRGWLCKILPFVFATRYS